MLSTENEILGVLEERYHVKSPLLLKGIGDDAAVIHPKGAEEDWLVTGDMLVENVDFRRGWSSPRELGCKSLCVNLSDLAAMGARPRGFTVSLALPGDLPESWLLSFYEGLSESGNSHGAMLVGGDLSRSEVIVISITLFGESLKRKVLYRGGGRAGDLLYVTGILGRSAAGLKLLEGGRVRPRSRIQREALQAHRAPQPRCKPGLWLAQCGMVSCMMDLSDGLSMDLPRMCKASGTGAEIYSSRLPVFPASLSWGCDPLDLAFHGGEDYELLFAVPKRKADTFEKSYPRNYPRITNIGRLCQGHEVVWVVEPGAGRRPLLEHGHDHFRPKSPRSR